MIPLPLANILHHKLRSALSALGVGIGVCMLVTLSGLARGSLEEVAQRWVGADADLIVYPARAMDNITTLSGGGLSAQDAAEVAALTVGGAPAVESVVPVFRYRAEIGGQEHDVFGVAPPDLRRLLGTRQILPGGRIYDPDGAFERWMRGRMADAGDGVFDPSEADLAGAGGLEMVIDRRLARAAGLGVGSTVYSAGHHFTIVGIVPAGAIVRAFVPRATAEFLVNGPLDRFTLMFVQLRAGVRVGAAAEAVRRTRRLAAVAPDEFRGMLESRFGIMYVYVDAVNAVTLVVAFLFVLVTLYTMVIQRTREIAILESMGATRGFILRGVLCESLILSAAGAAVGVGLSVVAAAVIETARPLLTVTISWTWIGVAAAAAGIGGTLAAIYPAFCAMRVDVVEALNLE